MRPGRTGWTAALALTLALAVAGGGCLSSGGKGRKGSEEGGENDPQYQYEKGRIALHYGLTDEAIRYGNLAVSLDPDHFNAWNLLGSAYYTKGEYAGSVEAYEKAAALKPDVAEVRRNLGLAYLEVGQAERAEACFQKAFEIGGDAESVFYLARTAYNRQEYEKALDWALKAIQRDGKKAGFYNLKGAILNQMGRYAEAIGSFQAGLVLAPEDINIQVNLGVAYFNNDDPEKAKAVLEKVLPQVQDAVLKARVENILKSIRGGQISTY